MKTLQHAVGILGWLSSVVPIARPWLSMLWAALTQQRNPVRQSTRHRKGLVFVKQVEHAIRWLSALVRELDHASPGLQCTFRSRPHAASILIQTDWLHFGRWQEIRLIGLMASLSRTACYSELLQAIRPFRVSGNFWQFGFPFCNLCRGHT